jgi:hypothetical protein
MQSPEVLQNRPAGTHTSIQGFLSAHISRGLPLDRKVASSVTSFFIHCRAGRLERRILIRVSFHRAGWGNELCSQFRDILGFDGISLPVARSFLNP